MTQVQAVLDRLVSDESEVGVQVAAYLNGRLVVDAWAGIADPARNRAVDGDTLFNVSSCGKGVAATCLHLLADRDQIDYDRPVADYWPEFAAHGKAKVSVRHVLAHRSGIPHSPPGYGPGLLVDWDRMCSAIADLEPIFEPGTKTAYQAVNFGFIVGELVRRIDGRSIGRFVREEIGQPVGADALFFGVPESELARVAVITGTAPPRARSDVPPPTVTPETFNRDDVRMAAIPSSGGIMTARALARHYALLAQGGALDGVRLLTPERIRLATELHTADVDELYKQPIKRSLGYRLGDDAGPGAGPSAFGHVGNGMFAYADPERQFAVAFLRNYAGAAPDVGVRVVSAIAAEFL
jgi:CubicO group peptidase (beta-lactamase class C family)